MIIQINNNNNGKIPILKELSVNSPQKLDPESTYLILRSKPNPTIEKVQ